MTLQPLQHISYIDPKANKNRDGSTGHDESQFDLTQYHQHIEQVHGAGLHTWGIASGLTTSATVGSPGVKVSPGIGLDSHGRHILLVVGGQAETNEGAVAGTTSTLVVVTGDGVTLPTTGFNGDQYLTIEWRETFDNATWLSSQGVTYQTLHTPWLRLQATPPAPTAVPNNGQQLILGRVSFDSNGNVTNLTPEGRSYVGIILGMVQIQKITTTPAPNVTVDSTRAGGIQALTSGGLDLTVANANDEVHLECDDGSNLAKVSLGAKKVVARRNDKTESVVIETESGSITTPGSLTTSSLTASGPITASSINAQNNVVGNSVSANTATVSGPITAGSIATSGGVTAGSVTASGLVNASSLAVSGPLTAGSIATSGGVMAGRVDIGDHVHITDDPAKGRPRGLVVLEDFANNQTLTLDGGFGELVVGSANNYGTVGVRDNAGATSILLNGSNGDVRLRGNITAGSMDIAGDAHLAGDFGNVGIGTTTPGSKLDVVQANSAAIRALSGDSNSHTSLSIGRTADEGRIGVAASAGQFANDAVAGDIILRTETTTPHLLFGNGPGNSTMAISNGNVGVGTTTPQSQLEVRGNITTPWGLIFQHNEPSMGGNQFRPYFHKAWDGTQGDFLYVGATGNGSNTNEIAMVLSQSQGVKFGTGTDNASGLNTELMRLTRDGNLIVGGGRKSFKIDHPLDAAKKYLYHASVESPDMKNIYDGVVVLDANGEAVVELPEWFEVLNKDLRYQLTCIGGYAPVYIAEKVNDNRFKIAGGKPEMEVSWQVTGIRQDAWAKAHPLAVEEDKPAQEQGCYLHPELYGESDEKSIMRARYPEMMQQL